MIEGNSRTYVVLVNGNILDPAKSLALVNHSPDGFAWGYSGSGPAQLALALLLELTTKVFALANYQQFKFDKIAALDPAEDFKMNTATIRAWARDHGWKGETDA